MKIGTGYDVHKLVKGRKLIIGGVNIPYEFGLDGHSDADVLTHAIMDSLLGAAALGDIGKHFPDNDVSYKGADSIVLLKKVLEIILSEGYYIENIDSTIIAQSPKLSPYIEQMRKNISLALQIDISKVSIKATTEEGLGFTGKKEGIAAQAVCLIDNIKSYGYDNNYLAALYNPETKEYLEQNRCSNCNGCMAKRNCTK